MIGASSCKELQLPAVTALTDKSGAQYRLLNSLHTLVKVRDTIHQLNEKRKKEREEEKRKKVKFWQFPIRLNQTRGLNIGNSSFIVFFLLEDETYFKCDVF